MQEKTEVGDCVGKIGGLGIPVIERDSLCYTENYQYKFPRSKKKRIRKKWYKNPFNFKERLVYIILLVGNNVIYCHPLLSSQLKSGNVAVKCKIMSMDKPGFNIPKFEFKAYEPDPIQLSCYYTQSILWKPSHLILNGVTA
jgi:hypothetical protein